MSKTHLVIIYIALPNQKVITAHFSSEQLPPLDFSPRRCMTCNDVMNQSEASGDPLDVMNQNEARGGGSPSPSCDLSD